MIDKKKKFTSEQLGKKSPYFKSSSKKNTIGKPNRKNMVYPEKTGFTY